MPYLVCKVKVGHILMLISISGSSLRLGQAPSKKDLQLPASFWMDLGLLTPVLGQLDTCLIHVNTHVANKDVSLLFEPAHKETWISWFDNVTSLVVDNTPGVVLKNEHTKTKVLYKASPKM